MSYYILMLWWPPHQSDRLGEITEVSQRHVKRGLQHTKPKVDGLKKVVLGTCCSFVPTASTIHNQALGP
jgi:hypothetical protein